MQKAAQSEIASPFSVALGEKTRKKPRPFTRAEKLETQKGIKNRRKVGQKARRLPPVVVLRSKATPTIPEIPTEVSQRFGLRSK